MRRLVLLAAVLLLCLVPSLAPAQYYGDPNSLVASWYQTYLNRAADLASAGWVSQLNQGTPPDQVLSAILGCPEYYQLAGATPQGFITLLYREILQREPTAPELNYWVGRMYTEGRQTIADQILTQNPGVWVGSTTAVAPSVAAPPSVVLPPGGVWPRSQWERDRHWDWDRRHDIHEFRRLWYHDHHDEHHH